MIWKSESRFCEKIMLSFSEGDLDRLTLNLAEHEICVVGPCRHRGDRWTGVTAAKRIIDLQDGPTLLVDHSYGGLIITEAGVDPNVTGLVYVAKHAPVIGEDEAAPARQEDAKRAGACV
jgi:hypothetical protein